jgi:tetratricopeptide (TPR) repeat protein
MNIDKVDYNVPVSDEVFDLEKKTGAVMVSEEGFKKRSDLFVKCCQLYDKEDYSASIKAGMQLYETYPDYWQTPEGLCVVGFSYEKLKDYDNAIKMFTKVLDEYKYPEYAPIDAWSGIGRNYKAMGDNAKAIEAYETLLRLLENRNAKEPGSCREEYFQYIKDQIAELKNVSEKDAQLQ